MDTGMATYTAAFVFPGTFALLPGIMDSLAARAMLLAIALQESRCAARFQIGGPARGFWQFERSGGVKGVLKHPLSSGHITHVCAELKYAPEIDACFTALAHNDVLACSFARLLLWTDAAMIPLKGQPARAWQMYLRTWRPGKPHPSTWDACYAAGWGIAQP